MVPVATEFRGIAGHGDDMTEPGWDIAVASGAHITLHGLIRLDASDLDGTVQTVPDPEAGRFHAKKAHATRATATITAAATNT